MIFRGRVGPLEHRVAQPALRRLAGCFKHGTIDVEQPAVIAAADAALLDAAVFERRAAVAAVTMHNTNATAAVAECDQIFAEDSHQLRKVAEV